MACGSCGGSAPVGGVPTTSADLSPEDGRYVVELPDGSKRTFTEYRAANDEKRRTGGRIRVARRPR